MENNIIKGEFIRAVGDELKRIAEDTRLGIDYVTICACALEFLEEVLGTEYSFPIDIELIMERMGIEVFYQPLDSVEGRSRNLPYRVVGRTFKRMNLLTQETMYGVLIDEESRFEEQRYAMAHELAHLLVHWQDKQFNSEYRVMPMLFKKVEEMVADIFAVFILIPLPLFLKEFDAYIGGRTRPVMTSDWLKYLSIVVGVPYEDVAIGYQNIRYVLGIIYGIMFENKEIPNVEDKRINNIINKHITKIEEVIQLEMVEKLFV